MSDGPALDGEQALAALHPKVQNLLTQHLSWRRLRPVQIQSIPAVLPARRDVLIVSGTASGKTEAAWLPIFSSLLTNPVQGLGVLALSPLKALIDDQTRRLAQHARHLDLRVDGWHGDISAARKARVLTEPPAGLHITPESLQSLMLNKRELLQEAVRNLRFVVVDEVHAFAGGDRGHQVQALLSQVEDLCGHRVCRVALSATVSTPEVMADYLRPGEGEMVRIVRPPEAPPNVDVCIRGYRSEKPLPMPKGRQDRPLRETVSQTSLEIVKTVDRETRGKRALVFCRSKAQVETTAHLLADHQVTGTMRPERFHAHHAALSSETRKRAERAMQELPDALTVCTSTLELGVDLPDLNLVVQVDSVQSVASLRQRLGRSGRTPGTRPVLRCFISQRKDKAGLADRINADLVQAIATVELIVERNWVEPTDLGDLGLSTLAHQVLAGLGDGRGATAGASYAELCVRGPWRRVQPAQFAELVRELARQGLVRQDEHGLLRLDEAGHSLVSKRTFLGVFTSFAEYKVMHRGREIGRLPHRSVLAVGSTFILAGRLWEVVALKGGGWTVEVEAADSGRPPHWSSPSAGVHAEVRRQMRTVYESDREPTGLDATASELLAEGRTVYRELGLAHRSMLGEDGRTTLICWTGDRQLDTLKRWLEREHTRLGVTRHVAGLQLDVDYDDAVVLLRAADRKPPEPLELAQYVGGKVLAKYDHLLPDSLLATAYAFRNLDVSGARTVLREVLEGRHHTAGHDAEPPELPAPRPALEVAEPATEP